MNVVVIGGTRFIGAYVVRQLVDAGHNLSVYHRGGNETTLPSTVRHVHDNRAGIPVLSFPDALLDPSPDVVIHMIAMGEADAHAAVSFFRGHARRIVVPSSGDAYLAYGRLTNLEPGDPVATPLREDSALRTVFYPYRKNAASPEALEYFYEKILVERVVLNVDRLAGTVLRLPKVYGPEDNADFATVHRFRNHPQWRWTHGYVENVAAAIVLAATDERAAGKIYNVGEEYTPTVAERLRDLPPSGIPAAEPGFNFAQDIVYDTSKIRSELGYREPVGYAEGIRRSLKSS